MLNIACPTDDAETVYKNAAARTRSADLRRALLAVSSRVAERAAEYVRLAGEERLYQLDSEDPIGVSSAALADVYDRVLVKGKERPLYNRIRASAKRSICPLCAQRTVKTLDHYLPQSDYPELAVFPANLVPACSDCNKTKQDRTARQHNEQTFHPYFDDWGNHTILSATVTIAAKVDVAFTIEGAAGFPARSLQRARHHFEMLELGSLYAAHAAVELVESKQLFRRNFLSGANVLQQELRYISRSRHTGNRNAWRGVLYAALSNSNEFFEGGFELIEE